MNAVIYASKGGNTKKLAEAVAKEINTTAQSVKKIETFETTVDLLFIGASLYAEKIDGTLRRFLKELTSDRVKQVAVFGTAAGNGSAIDEVRDILKDSGITVCDEVFQCRGSFLLANRGRPNQDDLKNVAEFVKKISEK